jgi:TatD DNase family protein
MQIVDSHAHLADPKFTSDLDRVIARAHESRVESIICIGDSVASSQKAIAIAHRHSKVFATAGLHPHSAKDWSDKVEAGLQELAADRRVVAIGETGLDYHHNHSDRAVQMTAFRQQVRLAKALRLPVVIHCREAAEDVVRVLEQEQSERLRGVIHCFAETLEIARRALDLGFHLGIGGLITFKTSETLRGVVAAIGLDRLVVETDSPYLAPVPKRGRRNGARRGHGSQRARRGPHHAPQRH